MLIDCHAHAFADKIADKAVLLLKDYYQLHTAYGGRLQDLLSIAAGAQLDALVLLVAATKPEQVRPANDWILALEAAEKFASNRDSGSNRIPRLVPFGTFHPDYPDWLDEVRRMKEAGIKGIKLHPDFQGIDLGDRRLFDFFAEVEGDFVLMIHVGDRKTCHTNLSTPNKLAVILDNFPNLCVIAAHMGGYLFWEEALQKLVGREVYLDTSSTLPYIDSGLLRRIISKHGAERILFGSDYPLRSPQQDFPLLEDIPWLTGYEKELIRGENCARLLRLSPERSSTARNAVDMERLQL